jgi:large subunit ribosomal protein L18
MLNKQEKRQRRHRRVRAKVIGTAKVPRLCVFRSAKHIYAQLIDDEKNKTILSASDLELKKSKIRNQKAKTKIEDKKIEKTEKPLTGKVAIAYEVGKLIAEKALEKKIETATFDRAGYKYHGRVKVLAEGAREGGLIF